MLWSYEETCTSVKLEPIEPQCDITAPNHNPAIVLLYLTCASHLLVTTLTKSSYVQVCIAVSMRVLSCAPALHNAGSRSSASQRI